MEVVVILAFAVFFFFGPFMLVRNEWVSKQRSNLIDRAGQKARVLINQGSENWRSPYEEFENRYFTYDEMIWCFWIWDIEKLKHRDYENSWQTYSS